MPEQLLYSQAACTLALGSRRLTQLAKDGKYQIAREGVTGDYVEGTNGDGTFTATRMRKGTLKVQVLSGGDDSKYLAAKVEGMTTTGIPVPEPLTFSDPLRKVAFRFPAAIIKKLADFEAALEPGAEEWEFTGPFNRVSL